jgi:hypothetical protein
VSDTEDFYGVSIGVGHNGEPDIITRHGGYEPRAMTIDELEPWLRLAKSRMSREAITDQPCVAL